MLAPHIVRDYVVYILLHRRPIKHCSVGLAHQGARSSVVSASVGMNIKQDLLTFLQRDATLENTGDTASIELSIVLGISCSRTNYASGLCLVLW